jgi:hypothetical protein
VECSAVQCSALHAFSLGQPGNGEEQDAEVVRCSAVQRSAV